MGASLAGRVRWATGVALLLAVLLAGCAAGGTPSGQAPVGGRAAVLTPVTATATPAAPPQPVAVQPSDAPRLDARSAYLADARGGEVYLAQGADTPVPMASTTKIMTALVALTYGSPDQRIVVGPAAAAMNNGINSVMGLRQGDVLTLRQLLYGLLLPSGDDAAVAIADGIAGSEQRFVALMNLQAALLGLRSTHYTNPHGLDEAGHYTTARDLATLALVAMRQPVFAAIVATPTLRIPATAEHGAYTLVTTNELLTDVPYPGTIGVKTGFTGGAGYCLVLLARAHGQTLVGVLLGDPTSYARFADAHRLLNWGFVAANALAPAQRIAGQAVLP